MLKSITVRSFKSLEDVHVELGIVNVFIGANGAGKSNLLEAIGVLSAAADGKVNDQTLLQRGVRPGVPSLYKSSFQSSATAGHIFFSGESERARYDVALNNPLEDPSPSWKFKTERFDQNGERIVSRGPNMKDRPNTENGLAALRAVELPEDAPGLALLRRLQNYVIYSPTTSVLRGVAVESQPRSPLGLSGGRLAESLQEVLRPAKNVSIEDRSFMERVSKDASDLIPWASSYGTGRTEELQLSPSASLLPRVVRFIDRYMKKKRNTISGYDASEGALFVLFMVVLAAHIQAPDFCAVDNADHGLNPRLASALTQLFTGWFLDHPRSRQVLMTSHSPAVLDGLPIQDERVRLFAVERDQNGKSFVKRIVVDERMLSKAREGWTLSRMWINGLIGGLADV